MQDLTTFIQQDLYPALFGQIPQAFPEMGFVSYKGGWASPLKLDGTQPTHPRKDKCVISRKCPTRILEQGGESADIITYQQGRGKQSVIEAVKTLAAICGLEVPNNGDSAEFAEYRKKVDAMTRIVQQAQKALWTESGKAVLSYLQEGRGYSTDFIRFAGMGYASPAVLSAMKEAGISNAFLQAGKHPLIIPYQSQGRVSGMVFRSIEPDTKPKYIDAFVSERETKRYNLFGLTGLNLTGDKEQDYYITVVEGELDALRASFAGIPNVVAASGGSLSAEALQIAKKRGVRAITILFDKEATEAAQSATNAKIGKAIKTIEAEGLRAYVAYFPGGEGEKVDADSYLTAHTAEELRAVINSADPASIFKAHLIHLSAIDRENREGISRISNDRYKEEILELCDTVESATEREEICKSFSDTTGGYWSAEAMLQEVKEYRANREQREREKAEAALLAELEKQQREGLVSLAIQIHQLTQQGKTGEALQRIDEAIPSLRERGKASTFEALLSTPTLAEMRERLAAQPKGLNTPYHFGVGNEREHLRLPAGALTFVCAPSGHGKSLFLQNIALYLAKEEPTEGAVLYFTFEEAITPTIARFINIHADLQLSRNNNRSILHWARTGSHEMFQSEADVSTFEHRAGDVFGLIETGKLRIFREDYDTATLLQAIEYISHRIRVKAVIIDHIQLLFLAGHKGQRKDELKAICKRLMESSVSLKIPFVVAAQLNRSEALSPIELPIQAISEASDIEQVADTIIMLWNSSVDARQASSYYQKGKGELSDAANQVTLLDPDFVLGHPGHIFANIAKNRNGSRNICNVFKVHPYSGRILTNAKAGECGYQQPAQSSGYTLPF